MLRRFVASAMLAGMTASVVAEEWEPATESATQERPTATVPT